ncbi:hypothetical protein KP509_33G009400 [Ceratopteris richardii]|uniref:Uncharacterized protein n=1 Tax=Ceratopteris richardii TaxID=49495 RepID=A0A8T2QNS4_CERRI|nr:hypothetical protein KP509_33G009400 [Ceratopteris richardii]
MSISRSVAHCRLPVALLLAFIAVMYAAEVQGGRTAASLFPSVHMNDTLNKNASFVDSSDMQVSCIRISQVDLHFSHPMSAASVYVDCGGCSVSNVQLACPATEWIQGIVPAVSDLVVEGNWKCLVASGAMLGPHTSNSFVYMHSPTLPLYPLSATCHCP